MPNRLAGETSPYLLQHAHNPVDWYPWGPEALGRAKDEDKPIFLSIGYAACHWCHVMERESFEDEGTATYLNARFVAIKVDREERPDVDAVYMEATQAMTGQGGWPMTVFMTADGHPFYCGTYFPRQHFQALLEAASRAWREQRDDVIGQGQQVVAALTSRAQPLPAAEQELDCRGGRELGRAAEAAVLGVVELAQPGHRGDRGELRCAERWLGLGAEVPAADDDRVPAQTRGHNR